VNPPLKDIDKYTVTATAKNPAKNVTNTVKTDTNEPLSGTGKYEIKKKSSSPSTPSTPSTPSSGNKDKGRSSGRSSTIGSGAITIAPSGWNCDGGAACPSRNYVDVNKSAWYHEPIDYAISHGLMNGVSDTLFDPNGNTSRAMIATILWRLEGSPKADDSTYTDVASGVWYSTAIGWAEDNNIVTGYGDGTFGPNNPITREQMAAILFRYAQYKKYDVSATSTLSSFTDTDQISAYAVDAMRWANGAGLITGVTETTIVPKGMATRAQVAAILMRFCENIAK
jgi:hypothetical protein